MDDNFTENSIGCIIRYLRKKKGLPQSELALKIGVKPQTIGKYETGIIEYPPIEKLKLIQSCIDEDNLIIEYLQHDFLFNNPERADHRPRKHQSGNQSRTHEAGSHRQGLQAIPC